MSTRRKRTILFAVGVALAARPGTELGASPAPGDGPEPPARVPVRVPTKAGASRVAVAADRPPVVRARASGEIAAGALSGKTVYLSAGHGWNYESGAWRTQRGNTNDLVEDFITAEGVNQYLIPYLHNMGAYVVPIRESDLSTVRVVVDDGEASLEGEVEELSSDDTGWADFETPLGDGHLNPFSQGAARRMAAAGAEGGRAVFPFEVPERGRYNVYVAYVQGPDRAPDAHYIVRHAGGESHFRIDQRRHGSTWVLLGRFWFEPGAAPEHSSVAVANDSESPGAVISLDAVRVGGGVGAFSRGGATTGRPAYESAARYSTQLLGAPPSVYDYFEGAAGDDVVARPRFAAWDHEEGEDAVYLAWHTNAPDPGRGTLSIAYGPQYPCCGGLGEFSGTAGSLELVHAVHDEVVADLRAQWDPAWPDQGKVTASLGELRPSHNGEMPAILVELAYHDTPADADALREPHFRRIAARAMAQGIARYFAARDGTPLSLPPEPPAALRVENDGEGGLRVSWRPPTPTPGGGDAPTGYRVYTSEGGYGFDEGVAAEGQSLVLDGLAPGATRFVRVTAINAGGESFPTEVVGARVAASGRAPVLLVSGYDRLDAFQAVRDDVAAYGLGVVDRLWLHRMNDRSYAVLHGGALAAAGYAFDGASDDAVELGDLDLTSYRAIDWFAGEDSLGDDPLSAPARDALERFFAAGGGFILSGSEVVWALEAKGTPEAQDFVRDLLHTSLAADDAGTYDVAPGDGPFSGVPAFSFAGTVPGGYDAEAPDSLTPGAGASAVLTYAGAGGVAAIAWDEGVAGSRGLVFGFPLELVEGEETRRALLDAGLGFLGVEKEPDAGEGEEGGDLEGGDLTAGCGCRAGPPGPSTLFPALLLALVLGLRRRRG